jgi:hypothetical protein
VARKKIDVEARRITQGIGRYLDEVEAGTVEGPRFVTLGALGKDFPAATDDPKVIERAIAHVKEQAQEGTSIERLKRTQRALTLSRKLDELVEAQASNGESEAFFIEHAYAWAEANGVGYGAFRAMGVPADVLRAAGITRGFQP